MVRKFLKLLGCFMVIGTSFASDDDPTDSYGQSLSDRLLAAEHLIATKQAGSVPGFFTSRELETDMGVKYFVGLSKLITQSDVDRGAELIEESAIERYSDAIGLIEFGCNLKVPSSRSTQVEAALKKLVW